MVINIHNDDANPAKSAAGAPNGGGCSSGTCGAGLEKVYPTAAVRYGYMKQVGEFRYPNKGMQFGCGAKVIIQTRRGIELGEMVSLTCEGCDKCVTREQIKRYVNASGPEYYQFGAGRMLRLATDGDLSDWEHIRAETLNKKRLCQERATHHGLNMKVIECEHIIGGERIVFYFMAEGRIDFRALVREMADEYQTRIEMRQVGARDEARLLADYETCGRECCCKNFLKQLKPISMKMAKMQKATLDPAKVSGRCGRLKCCLRYEHTTYETLDRNLPRNGQRLYTPQGPGIVVGRQILTQLLHVRTEEGGLVTVPVEDTSSQPLKPAVEKPTPAPPDTGAAPSRPNRQRRRRPRGPKRGSNANAPADGARGTPTAPESAPPTDRAPSQPGSQPPATGSAGESPPDTKAAGEQPRRRRGRGSRRGRGRREGPPPPPD